MSINKNRTIWFCLIYCLFCLSVLTGCNSKQENNSSLTNETAETTSQSILDKIGYKPVYETDVTDSTKSDGSDAVDSDSDGSDSNSSDSDGSTNSDTFDDSVELATSIEVDVDLTTLSPTMVYAEVYNMLASPDDYVGKVVKLSGTYYSINSDETGKTYFYVLIKDATACCEQGMEFIWDNGTHVYPDEYPEEQSEVTITGVFNYYTEDGLTFCYLDVDDM